MTTEGGQVRAFKLGAAPCSRGGQRFAALLTNLVVVEKELLEPRRCPLLAEGGPVHARARRADRVAR